MREPEKHQYLTEVTWQGNRGPGTADLKGYDRTFRVAIEGKPDLLGSSDPSFLGDPKLHNPEDLLVAAVASCHMLFYLALCARNGIVVQDYVDGATGTMVVEPRGGGRFEEIVLHPRVTIAAGGDLEKAEELHARANELCFIANTCNCPVRHEAEVRHG